MRRNASISPNLTPVTSPTTGVTASPETQHVGWVLSDRLDWALSLPVPPPARFVAVTLIKHTNSVTGLTCPAVSTLAKLTGYSKATVKTAIRQLEQGGHFDITRLKVDKVNVVNRYRANRGGVGQELPQGGSGADPEPVREPVNVQEVQLRTVGKPTETAKRAEKGRSGDQRNRPVTLPREPRNRSVTKSSPHSAQQRLIAALAEKLNLSDLLTASGLEDFACLDNSKKQSLIKRLLKAEAWHDARVGRSRSATAETETRNRPVTGSSRLLRAYADRYRIAHEPETEPEEDALAGLGDLIKQAPKAKGTDRGGRRAKLDGSRKIPSSSPPTLAAQGVDKKTANEEAPVAKRPWAEQKRAWKFERVDGSWE